MRTFCIQTLGCKVNQYESDQVASVLRGHGLIETSDPRDAELRIVNSCSVTVQAASKSGQATRRAVALPLLPTMHTQPTELANTDARRTGLPFNSQRKDDPSASETRMTPDALAHDSVVSRPRVIVMGCWSTGDPQAARSIAGVDAVLTHHDDIAAELDQLLTNWRVIGRSEHQNVTPTPTNRSVSQTAPQSALPGDNGWIDKKDVATQPAGSLTHVSKPIVSVEVNGIPISNQDQPETDSIHQRTKHALGARPASASTRATGTTTLPILTQRQPGRQRAVLKVQDGCDAHCTYCIIPRLRSTLWSKPIDDAVHEATQLVAAGHVELVITGIFLGAYGQPTALRRRQPASSDRTPLAHLIEALCTRVPGLHRLHLSSLEPGDLTSDLIDTLKAHSQVAGHFHLPLQSGSNAILRRMNRQYTRDDFLRMIDRVNESFDRPALTTDIIVGFPGETDAEFRATLDLVDRARFIHIHAFHFSPRPGTAAARWTKDFVRGPVVNERIKILTDRAASHSLAFRQSFIGETVKVLIEHNPPKELSPLPHGRCERYFDVQIINEAAIHLGDLVRARIESISNEHTLALASEYEPLRGHALPNEFPRAIDTSRIQ